MKPTKRIKRVMTRTEVALLTLADEVERLPYCESKVKAQILYLLGLEFVPPKKK